MSVFLRHPASGFYYGGPQVWVADAKRALDLKTIEDAIEETHRVGFVRMEVVAWFGDPNCEWVLSVLGGGTAYKKPLRSRRSGESASVARSLGAAAAPSLPPPPPP